MRLVQFTLARSEESVRCERVDLLTETTDVSPNHPSWADRRPLGRNWWDGRRIDNPGPRPATRHPATRQYIGQRLHLRDHPVCWERPTSLAKLSSPGASVRASTQYLC